MGVIQIRINTTGLPLPTTTPLFQTAQTPSIRLAEGSNGMVGNLPEPIVIPVTDGRRRKIA
jgi:hypothetical protein